MKQGLSSIRIAAGPRANQSGTIVSATNDGCIGVSALGKDGGSGFVAFQQSSSHTAFEQVGHIKGEFPCKRSSISDQDLEMVIIPNKDPESQY